METFENFLDVKVADKHYTPSNITEEDKKRIFDKMPRSISYCVVFDETIEDKGWMENEAFGTPTLEAYNNGEVTYQQMNYYETLAEAKEDCEILPKIKNRIYKNPFIVKR